MKKILFLILFVSSICSFAQKKTIMLTGASFGVSENGWFELGCKALDANVINKAVSGEAIYHTANRMYAGTFYTKEQLENTDCFVLMHVHNQNVANAEWLKEDYNEYSMPTQNYAIAYDYVIKKYKDDCYKLKDDPTSKYFGTKNGKPAQIILTTHWHDSRTVYNSAARALASKWNIPLIEWDTNIGFTKDVLDANGKQPSLQYAQDTETINGVVYGWHPKRGQSQFIQKKMAEIFVAKMAEVLNISIPAGVTAEAKNKVIWPNEKASVRFLFNGLSPWDLTYQVNEQNVSISDVTTNPLLIEIPYSETKVLNIRPTAVSNQSNPNGEIDNAANIYFADDSTPAYYDTYVLQSSKDKSYVAEPFIQLKTGDQWDRHAYFSFKTDKFKSTDKLIEFRIYLYEMNLNDLLSIQIEGNTNTYTNTLNWNTKDRYPFEEISVSKLYYSDLGSFISWDVTDWVKNNLSSSDITLRIRVTEGSGALCTFYSTESENSQYHPTILIAHEDNPTGISDTEENAAYISPLKFDTFICANNMKNSDINISNLSGQSMYTGRSDNDNFIINTNSYPKGVYILSWKTKTGTKTQKLIK